MAKELKKQGEEVIAVDVDEKRVETFRDQNIEAIVGDMRNKDLLKQLDAKNVSVALILGTDPKANKQALVNIKKGFPDTYVIVRAIDPISKEGLEETGADMVLLPSDVIASMTLKYLERSKSRKKMDELINIIKDVGKDRLAIIVHDNPDPDAIASAWALKYIANSLDVDTEILYRGEIRHQENQAFVNLLSIELEMVEEFDLDKFEKVAFVDVATSRDNKALSGREVDIIIDHHPITNENVSAEYTDIRPNVGSTSTIMVRYLQELDMPIEKELATALLYGIRTDTQSFKRNTHPADLTAAAFLYPLADHETLGKIETPAMSTETLDILGDAIRNRVIRGSYLLSNVGFILNRDALPQAADYLLNLEGISTSIVFGLYEDTIHISGRNRDIRINIGGVFSQAFGDIGSAGGHATAAAAQVPLGVFSGIKDRNTLIQLSEGAIMKRLMEAMGVEKEE